jgi:predicted transcriptional regulator
MESRTLVPKRDVLAILQAMADEIDLEELHYRLYVLQKIREGDAAYAAGNVISQEELERESDQWLR